MNRDAGFVLVATLWTLAALAILAGAIDRSVAADVERARLAKQSLQRQLDARSTEATLLYLLTTGRMNHRALLLEDEQVFRNQDQPAPAVAADVAELGLDGDVYVGLGEVRFSIQDEGGLASVNAPRSPLLTAALRHAGVPRADIARMTPRIRDYIDLDELLHLDGAERLDYRRRGLPPPANFPMASPLELKNVLGANRLIGPARWRRLRPLLTHGYPVGYNFNTMRPAIAAALLDLDAEGIRPLLEERARRPVASLGQVGALTGVYPALDPTLVTTVPSAWLRIATWSAKGGVRSVLGIRLTPTAVAAPWRKEYRYSEPVVVDSGELREPATPLLQSS